MEVDGQFKCGLEGEGLSDEQMQIRAVWRQLVTYINPTEKCEKMRRKKKKMVGHVRMF